MKEHSIRQIIPVEHWISVEGPIIIRHQPVSRSPLPHDCSHLFFTEPRAFQLQARLAPVAAEPDWAEILK